MRGLNKSLRVALLVIKCNSKDLYDVGKKDIKIKELRIFGITPYLAFGALPPPYFTN